MLLINIINDRLRKAQELGLTNIKCMGKGVPRHPMSVRLMQSIR